MVTDDKAKTTSTVNLSATTEFEVMVTDANTGCFAWGSKIIYVEEDEDDLLDIFNAFSPNGDGVNDIWPIRGIENFPANEVKIFNLWGDKIREFKGYNNENIMWDGTNDKGNLVPGGTYYYVISLTGNKSYTGWIHIK